MFPLMLREMVLQVNLEMTNSKLESTLLSQWIHFGQS